MPGQPLPPASARPLPSARPHPPASVRSLRLAHRGDWRVAPENTIEALLAALRIPGCDGLEFDVRLSADGVPVLLHDETLARVQRRPSRADGLSVADLAAAGVPTLAEVLAAIPPGAFLDVELKGDDHGSVTAGVLVAARGEAGKRAVVSSFEPPTLAAMADHLPGWVRWLGAEDLAPATMSLALGLGCAGISVGWGAITPARVREAHAAGLDVAAWTVRRRATFNRLDRLGVVACCVEAAALDG
jgi:glycerophosphoryl diester phosphodiesterase